MADTWRNLPEKLISEEQLEGWFCVLDEEGGVQNGRTVLELKGTLSAEIQKKVTHMAGHLPLRDGVALAEGMLHLPWAGCGGAGGRVIGSDLHFWRIINFWLPPGEWIRSDLIQKQQEQAVVICRRDMVPLLPLPDLPFRNWGLGGSRVVSEKSDLAGSDSRRLSSLNSQAACPEASADKDLCLLQEEPSLSPALSLLTVSAHLGTSGEED